MENRMNNTIKKDIITNMEDKIMNNKENATRIPMPVPGMPLVPVSLPCATPGTNWIDLERISKCADVFINHENQTIKIQSKRPPVPRDVAGNIIEETEEELLAKIEDAYQYVVATGRAHLYKKDEINIETRLGRYYSIKEGFHKHM